jgi:hypothetical protein
MTLTTRCALGFALVAFSLPASAQRGGRGGGPPIGTVEHVWKPVRDGGADVVAIEVRTQLTGFPDSLGRTFSVTAPITYAGVPRIAERVQNLEVKDASGVIELRVEDDAANPGGFPFYRHWRATRAVTFPVSISYRSLAPTTPVGGPPFGLFSAHGGVSGAGSGFLVLPELRGNVTNRVKWDVSDLAPGSSAATTFGLGDFELRGSVQAVQQGWIMAGPIGHYPAQGAPKGFTAVWLGTPTWDPLTEMKWASEMYQFLGKSYGRDSLPDYRVFVRVAALGQRGTTGTALASSFIGGANARQPGASAEGQSARTTFTHEMGHMFVGGIDGPQGVTSWFAEGLNVYYTRLLPVRGGFVSVDDYGRDINRAFQDYYKNAARNLSADSIVRIGFRDENVRHMPYARGSLYFADLDSKIRAHSDGKRNLDIVIRELFRKRDAGEPFNHDTWIAAVVKEAGPSARDDFEGIVLRGDKTLLPASDAFGPCFTRKETAGEYEWVRVSSISDDKCRQPW